MPRIRSLQPNSTVSVDLDHFVCRLDIGVTVLATTPCFTFLYLYPPSPAAMMRPDGALVPMGSFAVVALARAEVQVAREAADLEPVTRVALGNGSFEKDVARITEAFRLFANSPQNRRETIDACVTDSTAVLRAYWDAREWLGSEKREYKTIDVLSTRLVFEP